MSNRSTDAVYETARCRVRPWRSDEAPRVLEIYSRPEVQRWLPRAASTLAEAEERLAAWRDRDPSGRGGVWAVQRLADDVVVGTVLLVPLPGGDGEYEVGWHLDPEHWGQGYATEAGRGALEHGFGLGFEELFAVVNPDNVASRAVCGRLGMAHLGRTEKYYDATPLELFRLAR